MGKYDFDTAKKKYRELCKKENSIWIYMQDWYLDAACESADEWRVVLVEEKDEIIAAFPFGYKKIHGLWHIFNPWQCARMGIWQRQRVYKSKEEELIKQEKIVSEILARLPKYDDFCIAFNGDYCNWQPFYWNGFEATPKYSMIIDKIYEDGVYTPSKGRRQCVRSARNKGLTIKDKIISAEQYWIFLEESYVSRNRKIDYNKKRFMRLINALKEHDSVIIKGIYEGLNLIAACIVIEDAYRCYDQFHTQLKGQNNATSLAIYDAIEYATQKGKIFDFEGSMIRGVCGFNSSYNPEWEEYYIISKRSRRYRIIKDIQDIINAVLGR